MIASFGNYRLDTDNYLLLEDNKPVEVEPQVFAVLQTLIDNRHRVVTKQDLIDAIWNGRIMSDAAISSRIKSARQAIGDDGRAQRVIKTVHGVGFRFIAEVNVTASPGGNFRLAGPGAHATERVDDERPSILVLPFSQTGNSAPSILPQGLAHDIITGLSRLRWLKVISRSSAFKLSSSEEDLQRLLALTTVRYCLSGFVDTAGRQAHFSFELTDLQSGAIILADHIAMSRDQVNEVRTDITRRITSILEIQISEHEAQRAQLKSTENLDAWEAYHLATAHLYRFTAKDNEKATALFRHAVQLEPRFARAHAGLSAAEFQNAFNMYAGIDRNQAVQNAVQSAERSIELDRLDPLANFVMGRSHWLRGETEHSIAWLERALSLNPNYAHGYYAHGLASLMTSNERRGYDNAEHAVSLSPLDPFLYGFYGIKAFSYLADEDLENARVWAEKAALQPEAIVVMDMLAAAICEMNSDLLAARKWMERGKNRRADIDSDYFFEALPFGQGNIRSLITSSLMRLGL
ncbi:transcriptional regulator [Seongchinamella unica]|uniref:Transcriptional regulator n=1 Tax=Seongchinamella unica TaxID=2547392 RepID=A0A4R5LRE7_9GAMM|nr:winged helix-turn-helix domain-containing protein [Seongchinamella unica]TDG13439.1 transcriptional regulator [Seongchinamella unica]